MKLNKRSLTTHSLSFLGGALITTLISFAVGGGWPLFYETYFFSEHKDGSENIHSDTAEKWIKNYDDNPLNSLKHKDEKSGDKFKIKSFIFSQAVLYKIDSTEQANTSFKSIRCYLAKRNHGRARKDYTLVIVPADTDGTPLKSDSGKRFLWAMDWHKPCPPCEGQQRIKFNHAH